MSSKVKIISSKELENMHTGSLMSRRKALLTCEESLDVSDRDKNYQVETGYIEFKQSNEWKQAYRELKAVLDGRENWSRSKLK